MVSWPGLRLATSSRAFFFKTPRFVSCRTKGSSIGANNGSSSCSGSGVATGRAAVYSIGSASAFFLSLLSGVARSRRTSVAAGIGVAVVGESAASSALSGFSGLLVFSSDPGFSEVSTLAFGVLGFLHSGSWFGRLIGLSGCSRSAAATTAAVSVVSLALVVVGGVPVGEVPSLYALDKLSPLPDKLSPLARVNKGDKLSPLAAIRRDAATLCLSSDCCIPHGCPSGCKWIRAACPRGSSHVSFENARPPQSPEGKQIQCFSSSSLRALVTDRTETPILLACVAVFGQAVLLDFGFMWDVQKSR